MAASISRARNDVAVKTLYLRFAAYCVVCVSWVPRYATSAASVICLRCSGALRSPMTRMSTFSSSAMPTVASHHVTPQSSLIGWSRARNSRPYSTVFAITRVIRGFRSVAACGAHDEPCFIDSSTAGQLLQSSEILLLLKINTLYYSYLFVSVTIPFSKKTSDKQQRHFVNSNFYNFSSHKKF